MYSKFLNKYVNYVQKNNGTENIKLIYKDYNYKIFYQSTERLFYSFIGLINLHNEGKAMHLLLRVYM